MESAAETARLRQEIERALRRAFDPADVLPRLARLARLAPPASDDGIFAHRQLAELLVERHPWRAALYARRALQHRRDDDRAWAVLAFCHGMPILVILTTAFGDTLSSLTGALLG